jgi:carbamoyltransferase
LSRQLAQMLHSSTSHPRPHVTLLGISFGIDSGAALVRDGIVLAAVNEERLSRKKFQSGFPRRAIAELLRRAGRPHVRAVVLASTTWSAPVDLDTQSFDVPDFQQRALVAAGRAGLQRLALGNPAGVAAFRLVFGAMLRARYAGYRRILAENGVFAPITAVDHHEAHAAGAAFTSGWDDALVLTADGLGDGLCASVRAKRGPRLELLAEVPCFHSLGVFYTYVTHMMGFRFGREGKVTGLAAHGNPSAALHVFERFVTFDEASGGLRNHAGGIGADYEALRAALRPFRREDVAAAVQAHFERTLSALAGHYLRRTGLRRLALAGGVFANVRVNQVLRELPEVDALWVFPHMGDGGGAAGAALSAFYADDGLVPGDRATRTLAGLYLGPSFDALQVDAALGGIEGAVVRTAADPEAEGARLLAERRVVARVCGPMEYGPRALGNRSVLFHAGDRSVNDWLNKKLRRTEFMPFAPVILEEDAPLWLSDWKPEHASARFMTVTYRATERCAKLAPAVVHVDGTLRPQVLRASDNPAFHRLLLEYRRLTGLGILLNTSFNLHEEPIVCSPADAVRAFLQAGLDALLLGDRVVTRLRTPAGTGDAS